MGENSKRSGEWTQHTTPLPAASEFVTAQQFSDFVKEFREFTGNVDTNFKEVRKEMAEGSTRFALLEREVHAQTNRSDEHSGKITALERKESARTVEEDLHARSLQPKQHGAVITAFISAVITVAVAASCAVGYWVLHSYFQSQTPPTQAKP